MKAIQIFCFFGNLINCFVFTLAGDDTAASISFVAALVFLILITIPNGVN